MVSLTHIPEYERISSYSKVRCQVFKMFENILCNSKQTRFWMWTCLHVACDDWNEVSNLHKNPSAGWLSKHIQDSKISSYTNHQIISDPKICSELIGHFGPSLKKDHFTRIQASSSKCTSTTQIQPSHTDFTMVAFQYIVHRKTCKTTIASMARRSQYDMSKLGNLSFQKVLLKHIF